MNRAFGDKSMKFDTHLKKPLRKIFGYRAIAHFARMPLPVVECCEFI